MKNVLLIISLICLVNIIGCDDIYPEPISRSGVKTTKAKIVTQINGLTIEQENIKKRLEQENIAGSIKHLYIISPYSGQTIIYSTVKGKVTSSGKRLTPYTVVSAPNGLFGNHFDGFAVNFNGGSKQTSEVLQDDGTYGSSCEYIFWWDTKGIYHQHFLTGGQIIHVSEQPLAVKSVIINLDNVKEEVLIEKDNK